MLDMLRSKTKIFLWIVAIAFIISIGAGSIFGGGRRRGGQAAQQGLIGIVEGVPIRYQDFSEDYRQRLTNYAQQSGSELSDATRDAIREETWNALVTDILIEHQVQRLGIDVPNDAVFDALWNNPPSFVIQSPAFQDEQGNFSFDEYHRQIQMFPERWEAMADYYRQALQRQILQQEIQSAAMITDNELWNEFVAMNEQVRVSYVGIDPRRIDREPLIPTEEEARAYYEQHKSEYQRPSTASLYYVEFPKAATAEDEEDLVLRLEELAAAIRSGEDFAELARVYSEGPSGPEGGDLGYIKRGQMVQEFEDVAFSLGVGEVSEPVKTRFGYHLITVEDRRTVDGEPEVHARHILVEVRPSEETLVAIEERLSEFADRVRSDGIEEAAGEMGYEVEQTDDFPDDRFIPGIGNLRPAVKLTFENDPGTALGPFVTQDAYYMFEIAERNPSYLPTYNAMAEEVAASGAEHPAATALVMERQKERARAIADEIAAATKAGETLEDAATARGYRVNQTDFFTRRDYVPGIGRGGAFVGTSFALRTGATSGVVEGQNPNRFYVIRVEEKTAANQQDFAEQEEQLRSQLLQREQMELFSAWLEDLMADADIQDYRDSFF
jgi:parvulin-like peptidyl-prolyl isomerase